MIDIINVLTRSFLVVAIGVIAFLSRLSVTPVLEYDESRDKPEIVDRLILRDPTENEFIFTICLMIAVGTSTEKIIIRFVTAVISNKLNVDFQSEREGRKDREEILSRETPRLRSSEPEHHSIEFFNNDNQEIDDDWVVTDESRDPEEGP